MSQNLVDLQIDSTILNQLDAAIVQMDACLAGLVSLTPEQRRVVRATARRIAAVNE